MQTGLLFLFKYSLKTFVEMSSIAFVESTDEHCTFIPWSLILTLYLFWMLDVLSVCGNQVVWRCPLTIRKVIFFQSSILWGQTKQNFLFPRRIHCKCSLEEQAEMTKQKSSLSFNTHSPHRGIQYIIAHTHTHRVKKFTFNASSE